MRNDISVRPMFIRPLGWLVVGLAVFGFVFGQAPKSAAETSERPFQLSDEEDGIRIYKREIPGQELPGFRGEVVIAAPLERIVDVLKDHKRHTEWMHKCVAAEKIRDLGNGRSIDYNRTDAPWPVWDRDVVLEARWTFGEGNKVAMLAFKNTDPRLKPLPAKTVRMPRLEGFYKLWKLSPTSTKVVYQVEADPGGSLPTWLAKSVVRDLPFNTLSALRSRVAVR